MDGNAVALDMESDGVGAAEHVGHDNCAFLATEMTENKGVDGTVARGRDAVDAQEFVTTKESYFLGRTSSEDFLNADGIVDHGKGDAHPFEIALKSLVGSLHFAGGDVDAMGVEGTEHVADSLFAEMVGVGVGDILCLNEIHDFAQAFLAGDAVGHGYFLFKQSFEELCLRRWEGKSKQECKKNESFHESL